MMILESTSYHHHLLPLSAAANSFLVSCFLFNIFIFVTQEFMIYLLLRLSQH
jgi:hypothetical protein